MGRVTTSHRSKDWRFPPPVPALDVVGRRIPAVIREEVPGFGNKRSYHAHDVAYGRVQGITDAVMAIQQGESQTVVTLDPVKTAGLSALEKLVLADRQPSPFGGVVTGNQVIIYRD